MFTFFGHCSNLMVWHKVGDKQQRWGLRLSHAESIIQPDAEWPTDDTAYFHLQAIYQRFKFKIMCQLLNLPTRTLNPVQYK